MQSKVEALGQQKTSAYGAYFGVKLAGVGWVNVQGERNDSLKGQTVEYEIKDPNAKFKWAKLKLSASLPSANSNGHGKAGLNQFVMAEAVDFWWDKVKALELADEAKASVLCTLLIGTADGRIHYEQPDEPPAPFDDDIPF